MSHKLIVLPDDTAKPIIDAINGAKKSLNIRMFLFTDPTLIDAVIAAHQRGVKVRVMLNPARRSGESENEEARKLLTDAGIAVHDSNPAFALTHQKSMVIDDQTGFVESLNWEPKDLTLTRDYAIVTTHGHEVAEMVACFDADWEHEEFKPHPDSTLIWCPNNGRQRVAAFIDAAEAHAVAAKRALPGPGHHRTPGARGAPRRQDPHPVQEAAFAQGRQADRGRGRAAHPAGRGRQGPHAQGTEAARQDAAGRQQARHHRLDQPGAGQLRRAARTGDRDRRSGGGEAARRDRRTGLGQLAPARPERRSAAGRPEETRSSIRTSSCCRKTASTGATTTTATTAKAMARPRKAGNKDHEATSSRGKS